MMAQMTLLEYATEQTKECDALFTVDALANHAGVILRGASDSLVGVVIALNNVYARDVTASYAEQVWKHENVESCTVNVNGVMTEMADRSTLQHALKTFCEIAAIARMKDVPSIDWAAHAPEVSTVEGLRERFRG